MHHFTSNLSTKLLLVSALILGAADRCYAVNATTISSDGCVDKSGFEKCLSDASDTETKCINIADGASDLVLACGYGYQINQLNCYMSNCWNKVYSCEYAMLAAQYTSARDLVTPETIPFWPAPDNAPGGCSCNIGKAFINATQFILHSIDCGTRFVTDASSIDGCTCCSWSGALSAIYDICPNNDPSYFDISEYLSALSSFESETSTDCSSYVSDSCPSKYDIADVPGGKFRDPDTISSSFGSEPYSTTGATLTTPPGGATMTWSILNVVWTVIAAPAVDKDASDSTTSEVVFTTTNSAGATITSTSKSTATGTAAAGLSKTNSAENLSVEIKTVWALFMLGVLWVGF